MSADYTGGVRPGGGAAVRELGRLTITKVAVDEQMSNNCYLLRCHETGEQVLIDAADDAPTLLALAGDAGLTTVVTTHQHWDHHRALADVVAATGATTVAGRPDAEAITEQTGVAVARPVWDGDTVAVGSCTLRVIGLVGHTPGSIALVYDDPVAGGVHHHLFTGDSLFPGGVGNTFGDADAFRSLVDDVETKLFGTLPDETWFYPGHGDDSTLGAERPHLAEWRERGW
ncbi:MBL fold metallo-hydrolase [Nocardioides taihuensis]|uniref:MBL fold metallo-hydrolase n=1 Tax=Nocardioides taihuensis TaxID=1835606 RepID=A0ABW0BMM5_9ACTN